MSHWGLTHNTWNSAPNIVDSEVKYDRRTAECDTAATGWKSEHLLRKVHNFGCLYFVLTSDGGFWLPPAEILLRKAPCPVPAVNWCVWLNDIINEAVAVGFYIDFPINTTLEMGLILIRVICRFCGNDIVTANILYFLYYLIFISTQSISLNLQEITSIYITDTFNLWFVLFILPILWFVRTSSFNHYVLNQQT